MTKSIAELKPVRARNFTSLQLVLFAGSGVLSFAGFSAAGLAPGLALAGAGVFSVFVLAAWLLVANVFGGERGPAKGTSSD
jgi:hypothetical protein